MSGSHDDRTFTAARDRVEPSDASAPRGSRGGAPSSGDRQGERFTDRVFILEGGLGILYHAHDTQLKAPAALKQMPATAPRALTNLARPAVEVLVNDPTVVPVRCRWREGDSIWVAMDWVEGGGTLLHAINALFESVDGPQATVARPSRQRSTPPPGRVRPALDWVDLPSILLLLYEAALGIGAAHRAGVVHLDLKPDNLMFEMCRVERGGGQIREWRFWHGLSAEGAPPRPPTHMPRARVIDWDLAMRAGESEAFEGPPPGVPEYMAPERLGGRAGGTSRAADVYALGAILYRILTGRPPYGGDREHIRRLAASSVPPPPPPVEVHPRHQRYDTTAYVAVCQRALEGNPTHRYPDATAFAHALRRARSQVPRRLAHKRLEQGRALREGARARRAGAESALRALDECDYESVTARHRAWADIELARRDEAEVDLSEAQWLQTMRAILAVDPEFDEVALDLIEWQCDQLLSLERARDERGVRLVLEAVRTDLQQFQDRDAEGKHEDNPVLRRARALVEGHGTVSLRTVPPARIKIARQIWQRRRWVVGEDSFRSLPGEGSLDGVPIEAGRWLVQLSAEGHHTVFYPLTLHRGEHWPPLRRRAGTPPVVPLPPLGTLAADDCFIAPGPAWLGGEARSADSPKTGRAVWLDGFIVKQNPITNAEYVEFLEDLIARGRLDEARTRTPSLPGEERPTHPTFELRGHRFHLTSFGAPAPHMEQWPVCAISWFDAMAYASWYDERSQQGGSRRGWRLLSEWEYEKLARLTDERRLHWGDDPEPRFTRIAGSIRDQYRPAPVDATTCDVTLQGVRWVAGNVRTWCLDAWSFDSPQEHLDIVEVIRAAHASARYRMLRGASFHTPRGDVSGAARFAAEPSMRPFGAGLRLARSWPDVHLLGPGDGHSNNPEREDADVDADQ